MISQGLFNDPGGSLGIILGCRFEWFCFICLPFCSWFSCVLSCVFHLVLMLFHGLLMFVSCVSMLVSCCFMFYMFVSCFVHVCLCFVHVFFKFCFSPHERWVLRPCSVSSGIRLFSVEHRMQDRSFFIICLQCGSDVSVHICIVFVDVFLKVCGVCFFSCLLMFC